MTPQVARPWSLPERQFHQDPSLGDVWALGVRSRGLGIGSVSTPCAITFHRGRGPGGGGPGFPQASAPVPEGWEGKESPPSRPAGPLPSWLLGGLPIPLAVPST